MVDLVREVTWSWDWVVRGGEQIGESWGCPGCYHKEDRWTVQSPEGVETAYAERARKNCICELESRNWRFLSIYVCMYVFIYLFIYYNLMAYI